MKVTAVTLLAVAVTPLHALPLMQYEQADTQSRKAVDNSILENITIMTTMTITPRMHRRYPSMFKSIALRSLSRHIGSLTISRRSNQLATFTLQTT